MSDAELRDHVAHLEENLARRTRELAALNEIALAINSQPNVTALLEKIVELAAGLVGVRAGGVDLLQADGLTLELASAYYSMQRYLGRRLNLGEGLAGRVAQTGEAMSVADYAHWPQRAAVYEGSPFRRALAVPMKLSGRVIGVITVADDEQVGDFHADDIRLVSMLADQAAIAVSKARLLDEAQHELAERRRAEQIQAALHQISEAVHTVPTLDALYASIHTIIATLMPARNFFIALYDSVTNLIHMPYFADEEDVLSPPHPPGKSLSAYVLRTSQPLLATPSVFQELMARGEVELVGADSIDWLGVPLRTQTATIGVVVVQTYTEEVRLTEEHKRVLTFVSDQVAMAIERKRTEEALRQSEQQYRDLYAAAQRQARELTLLDRVRNTLTLEFDVSTVFRTVVNAITETFGYTLVSLYVLEGDVLHVRYAVGYPQVLQAIPVSMGICGRVARTRQPILLQNAQTDPEFIPTMPGPMSEVCVPLFDQARVVGVLNVESQGGDALSEADLRLMTALSAHISAAINRARLYTEAHESAARLSAAIESLPFDFWALDKEGRYILQNSTSAQLWGNRLGRHVSELSIDPALKAYWNEKDQRAFAGQVVEVDAEYDIGGQKRYYREISGPIRDGDQIQGILGVNIDITERKQIEEALRASQQMLQSIIDNIPQAVFWKDRNSIYQGCNRNFALDAGLSSPAEVVGKNDFEFPWPRAEAEEYRQFDRQVMENDQPIFHIIERQQLADGKWVWVETNKVPLHDMQGHVTGVLGTYENITERLRTEEMLRQTQKMESLGLLAGGVAHDFNNLLVAILGQTSLAARQLSADHPARPHLERAATAANRAADLTRQLLAYSGRGQFERRLIDLNTLIQENLHLFEVVLPKAVRLQADLMPGLPLIEGDTGQLQQVIMNLIINAGEAIGAQSGTVTVTTQLDTLAADAQGWWQYTGSPLAPGDYVRADVNDTGGGMSPETLQKIFDPFFTTKFTGRGLGLAAVLGIVRGHHGGLKVDSRPGQGTTFRLVFPAIRPADAALAPETIGGKNMTGHQLLVIDDEEPVRTAVSDILELEGWAVLTAATGEEGLEVYRQRQADIDLVLLDLSMPGLSGEETFVQLRRLNPNVRVLLSSGYSQVEVAQRFSGQQHVGFIQKPYDDLKLAQEVARHVSQADQ